MTVSKSIPNYDSQGVIGVLTSLSTPEKGITCSAWVTVDTGFS
jgi:hypothetical protein